MPYTIRKVPNKRCYKVTTTRTGRTHAKCTTLQKAKAQKRILEKNEKR